MATTETKAETPAPELVLAARYRREIQKAAKRTYNRAVKQFAEDAGCSEAAAARWLETIGVVQPTNGS